MEKRYQVFVSSTYEDLHEERQEVMHALLELDCIPAGMELFPAASEDQWSLIKRVIDDCDYYIVISAGRYGSIGKNDLSFTEMEYRYALEKGKPIIAFLHKDTESLQARKTEKTPDGKKKLDAFRNLLQQKMCKYWESPAELGSVVSRSIVRLIKTNPSVGWVRADQLLNEEVKGEPDTQLLITQTSELVNSAKESGLEIVYSDRNGALQKFSRFIDEEPSEIKVVGSSLRGLTLLISNFDELVKKNPTKFHFILTHPDYSKERSLLEGREKDAIREEIIEHIKKLIQLKVSPANIRLFKGSPTIFMISTTNHMLLNPYPYGTEAYRCFSLQVSSSGYIYSQYYKKHYKEIWDDLPTAQDFINIS